MPPQMANEIKPELMKAERRLVVVETQRRTVAALLRHFHGCLASTFADDFHQRAPEGAGTYRPAPPDGKALLYRGRVNTIVARRAAGKTLGGDRRCCRRSQDRRKALYFDMEDARTGGVARFHAIGVDIDSAGA